MSRLYPTKSVKYLGIKIDKNLTWIDHINDTANKLNRAHALLFKVRDFLNITICHLNYANTVWGQNRYFMNRPIILQKKALHIMSFECRNAHSNSPFLDMKPSNFPTKL